MTGTSYAANDTAARSFTRSLQEEAFLAAALKYRGLTYEELRQRPEDLNNLAEKAWDFFSLALRSRRSFHYISLSPLEFDEILSIVTMHYLEKFDRLWAGSSPEYYMSSVVQQMNNKVLDAAVRPFVGTVNQSSASVSLDLLDTFLCAPANTEDLVMLREKLRLCFSYSEKKCSQFELICLIATKCLRIKNSALAEKIMRHGFSAVCRSVIVSAATICELEPDSIRMFCSLQNFPLPVYKDRSELSDKISKASFACARKMRSAVLKTLGKEETEEVFSPFYCLESSMKVSNRPLA